MKARTVPLAVKSHRIYLTISLVMWFFFMTLSALIGLLRDNGDETARLLADPANALTGSFAGVVVGAYFVERWQERIKEDARNDARTEWVTWNSEYILTAHDAMRAVLSELVGITYGRFERALGAERIPDDILREDVTRGPVLPPQQGSDEDTIEFLIRRLALMKGQDEVGRVVEGPLAVAMGQLSDVRKYLAEARPSVLPKSMKERIRELALPVPDTAEAIVGAFTDEVAARLEYLADHVQKLTPDMTGVEEFEPGKLRIHVIDLLTAVRGIQPALEACSGKGDDLNVAERLADHSWEILTSALFIREAVWDGGKGVLAEVDRHGDKKLLRNISRMPWNHSFRDRQWKQWLREHGRP